MYARIENYMSSDLPKWHTKTFRLPDYVSEEHVVFYRDVRECAAYLFGNPAFSDVTDYESIKVFSSDQSKQFYHEMCSGNLWNDWQVSILCSIQAGMHVLMITRSVQAALACQHPRYHHSLNHPCV